MRQSVEPGAGHAELGRDGVGRRVGQHVHGDLGGHGAEVGEVEADRVAHAGLRPHLVDGVARVAREEADAVGVADDLVEAVERRPPGQRGVDRLHDVEGGHRVEHEGRDDPERAQTDDGGLEGVVAAADDLERAVGPDDLDGGDRGGQGGIADPEPCVPVCTAPATEMCGSEARFGSARPCRCSSAARTACVVPAPTRTVSAAGSSSIGTSSRSSATSVPSVSATRLNECRDPRAFTLREEVMTSRTSSTVVG